MTFKDCITTHCTEYAKNPLARFIGYNTIYGSRVYGTLSNVDKSQCVETPVAENLMMGLAMGMAIEGLKPVVCFERHDFLLIALDALVNHVDKMPYLSGDRFKFPIIIRAITGATKPLESGVQHTQEYTRELRLLLKHTIVYEPLTESIFKEVWRHDARFSLPKESGAIVVVEHRDLYDKQLGTVAA